MYLVRHRSTDVRRGVCKELAPRSISVNAVAPGPMDTRKYYANMTDYYRKLNCVHLALFCSQDTPEVVEPHKAKGMGERLTQVKDIASVVNFLSTEGSWITGQMLFANGGYTTQ